MEKERNSIGDIKIPKQSTDFWEKQNQKRWTHVFHFKDKRGIFLPINFDGMSRKELPKDFPKFDLKEVDIFKSPPAPPWDDWIHWKGKYQQYFTKFFYPVFSNVQKNDRPMDIDKTRIIIDKEKYDQFRSFIKEYKLEDHQDFILFLLAKIEDLYITDIEYYERPEQRDRIKRFPKEVDSLIKALKFSSPDFREKKSKRHPPTLEQITFHFNTEGSIKVTDPLLTSSIVDATRKSFDDGSMRNWEKQLKGFPSVYDENQQPNEFRYRICKALHNFFKGVDAFNFGTKNTTDKEVRAIAWMLDFAHVRFLNKKSKEYHIEEDKYELRQVVRHHITRKELAYRPTHLTANELKPDLEKLLKYFSKQFLQAGSPVYKEHDIQEILTIADRFSLRNIFPELIQIFTSLENYHFMVSHQFEACFNKEVIEQNKDYKALKSLLEMFKADGNIQDLQFRIHGIAEEFSLNEKASLEIVKKALDEYHENHKPEFEVDIYESKLEIGKQGFKLTPTGKLNDPANRFLPDFVRRCYEFLLHEAPPDEHDWMPSERYYSIIGLLLTRSWYFGHQMWDERDIIAQVKYWHSLR